MINAITILETSMVAPTPGKRKTPDDDNPLNAVIKKRREASTRGHASNKLKFLNGGDEETGGLVIVRAASSTDKTSSQEPPPFQLPSRSRSLSVSSQVQGPPPKRVSDVTLYKHIDPKVSEPQRARQLLVWSAHRASTTPTSSSIHSMQQGKDLLPKLNSEGTTVLSQVRERIIKMLIDKAIDTSAYSDDTSTSSSTQVKANEQNVMNRSREEKFLARIERAKAEDQAWVEVSQFYNSYKENSESALRRQPLISTKSKGKQRATDAEIWSTMGRELPPQFQGRKGVDMALQLIEEASTCVGPSTKLKERLTGMELKLEDLYKRSRAALECTSAIEDELNRRFADINIAISSTNVLPPIPNDTLPPRLLHIPHGPKSHSTMTDPQDVLRALSRIDMQRPPAQVGDSARRAAREAQRANESSNVERKLTGIPSTPRKAPGTPRRAGTPGRR